ncbi:LysR family transcriptional regulator [Pigmentiphaga sp.]|uniref:LysR family transcriptional regulator n=1 Tax=Pigmentiphaga sp. TaxID=1977564 RepID=UPI00128E6A4C|nr:LysR family transcriptional regulator [Pigmentiphaga sp.]MPS30602.1 LysR family transcriptional regulator [Alcaligenaceae bacterium SAGV5]MPS53619.1 LysR family transcriptional regulator [Alcaligenaceae bacterium SAGV3]MPT57960.1 LysR family transcriptional regulator [Alcaligenaceae bacterium]
MTLKQLEAFYWAATCESFATAALRLHLSQSSLSKRIGELEACLGKTLFDRDQRRARLTPVGRALLPHARQLLTSAEHIVATIGSEGDLRGSCRFGVGEIAASSWLPRFAAKVKKQFPDLLLEPYVELGRELEARLIGGELDFAMIGSRSTHPQLDSQRLAQVQFVWAIAADVAPSARRAEDAIAELPIISMSKGSGARRILDAWMKSQRCEHAAVVTCNNMSSMAGLVAAGLGISYFPRGWLRPLTDKGILRVLPSRTPLQKLDYHFHWRVDDTRAYIPRLRGLMASEVDYDVSLLQL